MDFPEVYEKLRNSPKIYIPMSKGSRSINLANAVSICLYEAWKQINFQFLKITKKIFGEA